MVGAMTLRAIWTAIRANGLRLWWRAVPSAPATPMPTGPFKSPPAYPARATPPPSVTHALPPLPPLARGRVPAIPTSINPPTSVGRREALRRHGIFHLFERAGLGPPPLLIWSFVDGDDIGRGVDASLRLTGSPDSDRLDQLLRAEPGLRRAGAAERSTWLADLLSGDPARFDAAVEAVRRLAVPRLEDHWPDGLLAGLQPVAADVGQEVAAALADHAAHRAALLAHWPEDWTHGREGAQVCAEIARFEEAEVAVLAAMTGGGDPRPAMGVLDAANAALAVLAAGASGRAAAGLSASVDTSELDAATAWPDALGHWRALRWHHHPDRPGLDDAERAERRRRCAAVDRALDRRERLLRAGTP